MNLEQAELALKNWFGYDHFRPLQWDVINAIYQGNDALVLMPTGGGKSICFQIPAITMDGMTLVISPLISLMKDQVESLKANGIAAAFINSSQSITEQAEVEQKVLSNDIKLLYVSPEKLVSGSFMPLLRACKLRLLAIDEAHCISSWGHDFRPEYTQLKFLRSEFPDVPFIALTATADKLTREDIKAQLGITEAKTFLSSFDRPNFTMEVRQGIKKIPQIVSYAKSRNDESGIVYCISRKATESLAESLKAAGLSADFYHAGMKVEDRDRVQEDFINDRLQIVCATIAFGMGIDKSNVRYVIHHNLPQSIENYYQEIGRAGRDGLAADTILFYSLNDVATYHFLFEKDQVGDPSEKSLKYTKLERMLEYAQSMLCRRKILLNYFSEDYPGNCGKCDICKNPPKFFDATIETQKALSAVARTNQRVGIGLLIDILRGSNKKEIIVKKYHQIKTYGAGGDLSAFDWKFLIQQMIQLGVFEIAYHSGNQLRIGTLGKEILTGKQRINLARPTELIQKIKEQKTKGGSKSKSKTKAVLSAIDVDLFQKLRSLRRHIAKAAGVPPYVVFSDASLQEMSQQRPVTKPEFSLISGVGEKKLEKYGPAFMGVIREYVAATA